MLISVLEGLNGIVGGSSPAEGGQRRQRAKLRSSFKMMKPLPRLRRLKSRQCVFHAVFGPTRTKLMGEAFERAIGLFEIAPPKGAREAMANRIIEAVHRGECDVDQLVDAALVGTGLTR